MIKPNFRHDINGKKLATAIAQDYKTNEILMLAFIDEEAFNKTMETKKAHYYSTSRDAIWFKGEESGHIQSVKEILFDCDKDAVIFKIEQIGGACHTGHPRLPDACAAAMEARPARLQEHRHRQQGLICIIRYGGWDSHHTDERHQGKPSSVG